MPLQVLAGPGCDGVGKDKYLEDALEPDDVVISVGRIFKALTGSSGVPSENPPALRLALGLRSVAIRSAREKELSGYVLTSNGSRAHLDRLADGGGRGRRHGAEVHRGASVRARRADCERRGAAIAACEEGIKARWFARYQPKASDREVDP